MCSFADQFHNVEILTYYGGVEIINDSVKRALTTIYWTSERLKSRGAKLETKLGKIRLS
jgi:hypothetical protein